MTTDAALLAWEQAWATGDEGAAAHPRQFPPSLLLRDDVVFVEVRDGDRRVGGCALNASDDVVGASNTYVLAGDPRECWAAFVAAADACFPTRPLVGYERGDALVHASAAGFETIGPLRVWT